jgi:hypothetical protein
MAAAKFTSEGDGACVINPRTLLYEAANVILTRHKGQLKLKD